MEPLHGLWQRLKYLLPSYRRAEERDMREELDSLKSMAEPRELGNLERAAENAREVWRFVWLDDASRDLRYALRMLIRNKAFSAAAVATLALGIGANTAVFSVFDAVLIKELPVKSPKELVLFQWLRTRDAMVAGYAGYGRPGIRTAFSSLTFERIRDYSSTLSDVIAFVRADDLIVAADGQAETATGELVSGNYFAGLGVPVAQGRAMTSLDDHIDADPVAVISHRYWQRRFNSDPLVVGKSIEVNRTHFVIIGVAPEGFHGLSVTESIDLALPIAFAPRLAPNGKGWPRSVWWVQVMGRLKPAVTREQALADIQALYEDSARESWAARTADSPNQNGAVVPKLRLIAGGQGTDGPRLDAMPVLSAIFVIVGTVLLIGCVNLANLLTARASTRRQEVSVRLALGASRWRVIRQLLVESLVLAMGGAIAGTILAGWGKDFLTWLPTSDPPVVDTRIDPRVLAFTAGLSVMTALFFGLAPALRATRTDLSLSARIGSQKPGGGGERIRRILVIVQVSVCLLLLIGAGLSIRTVQNLNRVDVGFDPDNLLIFRVDPVIRADADRRALQFYEEVIAGLQAIPGVREATLSRVPVIARSEVGDTIFLDRGDSLRGDYVFTQNVRWNFFQTLGIPLIKGRALSSADNEKASRVALINEAMVRQLFKDENPIGRRFHFAQGPDHDRWIEVVGIVRDAKYARLQEPAPPTIYLPYTQVPPSAMTFEVRTAADPLELVSAMRQAVRQVDPNIPIAGVKTQKQQIAETIGLPRTFAALTSIVGIVGLLLACVGLYGIVAFSVGRRSSEIGVRMALGAQRSDVMRLVLRETIIVIAIGIGVGVSLTIAASRLLRGVVFGIAPTDPLTIAVAVLLLTSIAMSAAYLPARRALRVDPSETLRSE